MTQPLLTTESPRIKILQYMYGDFEYFAWSERINRVYAKRHGYQYVVSRGRPREDRDITWHKVPLIRAEMRDDCDYLLWLDADAVFYSQELRIEEELIPLMGEYSLLFTPDIFCEEKRWNEELPCSGVILMKNDDTTQEFLNVWDDSSLVDPDTRWAWPPDQLGLWRVVLPTYRDKIKLLPDYYLMNGIYGQYIRHFPRMTDQERTEGIKHVCRIRGI